MFILQQNDYVKLYNNTIRPIVEGLDRSRPFLLSSPGNGMSLEGKDGIAPNASSEKYGDIHFYKDFSNLWSVKTYPIPRCATEYGVQSLPRRLALSSLINFYLMFTELFDIFFDQILSIPIFHMLISVRFGKQYKDEQSFNEP
ncbi:hypothetical protein AB6A40_011688 [Gnathostoma spinigerum]|uniref:Uncharacterized protein n=1 Tax=Gnathostoma spinigerum TaxID=75299 RepID=A0ABD6F3U1_9BILA